MTRLTTRESSGREWSRTYHAWHVVTGCTLLLLCLSLSLYPDLLLACFLSQPSYPINPLLLYCIKTHTPYRPTLLTRAGACRRVKTSQAWYGRDHSFPVESLAIGRVTRNSDQQEVQGQRPTHQHGTNLHRMLLLLLPRGLH